MKSLIPTIAIAWVFGVSVLAGGPDSAPSAEAPKPIAVAKLEPKLDQKNVTIKFAVSELGGVAQLSIPGKAPAFVIEAASEHAKKDLTVWIEGELAEVLDHLQLSYYGSNPIKKGTIIVATGSLSFSEGAGDRQGHEWYTLKVDKWQEFRIVSPDRQP